MPAKVTSTMIVTSVERVGIAKGGGSCSAMGSHANNNKGTYTEKGKHSFIARWLRPLTNYQSWIDWLTARRAMAEVYGGRIGVKSNLMPP